VKYVICWKRKRHGTTVSFEAARQRMSALLDTWLAAPRGVVVHQVLDRTAESGGYLVIETEDPAAFAEMRGVFADFHVHIDPVSDARLPARGLALAG
jgi:hypothetical protein